MSSEHAPESKIVAANLLCSPSTLCRHTGLLFGERLDTHFRSFLCQRIRKYLHSPVHTLLDSLQIYFFFHSGERIYFFRIRCQIRCMRVDGTCSRIRIEKVADSKISQYVWTGPKRLPSTGHAFSIPPTATNLALFHILASCQAKILSFSHLKQTLIIKMALTDLNTCHRLPRGGGPRADVGLCKLYIQSSCISPPVGDFLLAMSPVFGKAKHPTGFNYFFLNGT